MEDFLKIINYVSTISIPLIFVIIILYGIKEKNKVYDTFIEGVKEGIEIVIKLFPTILAIFVAVGMLRNSGLIDFITNILFTLIKNNSIPVEIVPLALLRPISGSASLAIATDIMQTYGVDSNIGKIASTIMGSTETTFYTIAVYTSSVNIKKIRYVLIAALAADFVGIATSILIWNIIN